TAQENNASPGRLSSRAVRKIESRLLGCSSRASARRRGINAERFAFLGPSPGPFQPSASTVTIRNARVSTAPGDYGALIWRIILSASAAAVGFFRSAL